MSEASAAGAPITQEHSQSDEFDLPSTSNTTPPTPDDIDRWRYHISLQEFGESLHAAAQAVFPNHERSRYTKVFVLMLCWEDEDPRLPVSVEIDKLFNVFKYTYNFETEIWRIPDRNSHARSNQKILDFVEIGDDSLDHLKIIYYAGHAKLSKNRLLTWTSWRDNNLSKCPTVKWSGIQNVLEEAQSDVLILLDCCAGGAVNTLEGNGVTELIAACGYNAIANGVGPYSFTHALILELLDLSSKPPFTVAYLYNNIFTRIQGRMPEDGRERHPPPIHLVLTQESRLPRSIQLGKCPKLNLAEIFELESREISSVAEGKRPERADTSSNPPDNSAGTGSFPRMSPSSPPAEVPRLAFAIRLNDTLRPDQLRTDLFVEWLRSVPAVAEEVKVEAGFDSFSSLIILSIPISLSTFLPDNRAIVSLGPITSLNKVRPPKPVAQKARVINSWEPPGKSDTGPLGREQTIVIEPSRNSKRSKAGKQGPIFHQPSNSMEPPRQPKPIPGRPQPPSGFTSVLAQVSEEANTPIPSNVRVKSPGTSSNLQSAKRLPIVDEGQKGSQKLGYPTPPSSGEATPRSSQENYGPLLDGR